MDERSILNKFSPLFRIFNGVKRMVALDAQFNSFCFSCSIYPSLLQAIGISLAQTICMSSTFFVLYGRRFLKLAVGVLLFIFVSVGRNSVASNTGFCASLLSLSDRGSQMRAPKDSSSPEATSSFIGYLGTLLENQIIGDRELFRLIDNLKKGVLENPITEEDTHISSSLFIHREGLEKYIKSAQIDQGELLIWAEKNLKEKGRIQVRREETRAETHDVHRKVEFNKINPGRFEMGEGHRKVWVTLTKSYEMMSTPVTQKQWSVIEGENPAYFVDGEDTIVMQIDGKAVKMRPDNPIEQVSWDDVQKYIVKLNELSQKDDPRLYQLIPGHQKGDKYRLPTEAEWKYVVKNRGRANDEYHFGNNEADLKDYGRYQVNSRDGTHPVAQLKPLVVDGKEFYDMLGNVWEWVEDGWQDNLPGGINPVMTDPSDYRVLLGGSWTNGPKELRSTFRYSYAHTNRNYHIGFRLVRIRPKTF